jgi:hypothetical protein
LIAGNEESLSYREDETLVKENEILADFLPKQMTLEEIDLFIIGEKLFGKESELYESVVAAGNDGQAVGMAMKALKAAGKSVDGKLVKQSVGTLRGKNDR